MNEQQRELWRQEDEGCFVSPSFSSSPAAQIVVAVTFKHENGKTRAARGQEVSWGGAEGAVVS